MAHFKFRHSLPLSTRNHLDRLKAERMAAKSAARKARKKKRKGVCYVEGHPKGFCPGCMRQWSKDTGLPTAHHLFGRKVSNAAISLCRNCHDTVHALVHETELASGRFSTEASIVALLNPVRQREQA